MKITGQILKENRERKGITVNEVAIATKINTKTIMALESGDVDRLPPKTFLRGFVRAYATFLELDVESLMATFYEEMGSTKPKAQAEEDLVKPRSSSGDADSAINPKTSLSVKIGAVTGILLLVVLIVFFKNKMESYEKETIVEGLPTGLESLNAGPTVDPNLTPAGTPESSPTPEDPSALAAAGASPAPASESPTPTPAASPSPTPAPAVVAPVPSPTPTATPTPAPTPKATPVATATPTPGPTPTPAPKASPSPTPAASATPVPAAKAQDIIIEAMKSVEIDAQIDGENKKFRLSTEQIQQIKARRKVILRFNDGGAVNVTVNGQDRGVPGDLGKPARIEIP